MFDATIETGDVVEKNEGESSLALLEKMTGVSADSPKIQEWRVGVIGAKELNDEEMQIALLYGQITAEQARIIKRSDVPDEVLQAAGQFAHSSSEALAEIIVNRKVEPSLRDINTAREKLAEIMKKHGIQDIGNKIEPKPEPNVLAFEDLVNQEVDRPFIKDPLIIVGLTTHGDVPAYVLSKLLFKKGIVSSVAFIRPTSRGEGSVVRVLEEDRVRLLEAKERNSKVLVADDSVEGGASMMQSLKYLENELPDQEKTVCVAVALEVPFLKEIEGEKYETIDHEGKKLYIKPAFFEPKVEEMGSISEQS
ncbi:MAG: hypothetical protein UW68_C0009G0008 [Candidatus Collierbacteria bacterium GW2011_GWB1_44_6]|uniref:Phosphoribosyltransferase domain-containing protein n=2 Tax=Candidatus Collieribacteriota TaxID=1752725 RepID=A0A0G1JQ00_9BACT|nr:MAG: hypothetical protein UV68_C0034G0002 [Candidatus Collierbacteria bacterium GW2011_GWC2_43_12]KKT73433.1 MAG: hypothetical protein UW68_C0009G0008 [Candidatus Collierbacteria bacterium GW2011_GWB1_44_6]